MSQPPRNSAWGGRERQDYLAPTSTLATTPVPRWSKREAKMQPCHKGCTEPYMAATASFPSLLTNPLLAPVVGRGSAGFWPPQMISSRSHAKSLTVPFKVLPLLSLLRAQPLREAKSKFVGVAEVGSNGKEAPIYMPKGGLSSPRPLRRVTHHGRSKPKLDARARSEN